MKIIDRTLSIGSTPHCYDSKSDCSINLIEDNVDIQIFKVDIERKQDHPIEIKWRMPCNNVKGVWSTNALHEKRLRADWELPYLQSRISVDAPVLSVYDHLDYNVITIAVSDYISTIELEASIQEEDGCLHCIVRLQVEEIDREDGYSCLLRVSKLNQPFSEALAEVASWWSEGLALSNVSESASFPVYSTWYAYHQNFTAEELFAECVEAKKIGYRGIIVDDGWQTTDDGRGYDFTGDWEVERITDVKAFVQSIHEMDMYCMFWFSVPFCGRKSKAYNRFKGKFLTENHPWAPVFDPRYPEVREYLVSRYVEAIGAWNLDGLKLDFIDDFKVYKETDLTDGGGKDCISVNEGVKRLINLIRTELYKIKPDVLIEFRQKYTGPHLQTLGNMFRAFDAPYDSLTNRIRTTDVKMLVGKSIVHSDMIAWHTSEEVEVAALQMTNIMFSVPQLSVRLKETSDEHKKMIGFLTGYWTNHKNILLHGSFRAHKPSSNYPVLSAEQGGQIIFGVYEDVLVQVEGSYRSIHFINGKMTDQVIFELEEGLAKVHVVIYDCMGQKDWEAVEDFAEGVHTLEVPPNGIIQLDTSSQLKIV